MNCFGITDRGKVRRDNQDSFLIERIEGRDCLVAVLCDGMGGERAGNVASDLAAKTFMSGVRQRLASSKLKLPDCASIMQKACSDANYMVYSYSCFDRQFTGMGTTLVAAMFINGRVFVLNVGDSRAYRISRSRITQVSHDHSLVQEMVDRGELTAEEARTHPRRNVITRALGVDENVPCDVFTPRFPKGSRLLLCSDGLTNMLRDSEIQLLSRDHPDPYALGHALLNEALERGAGDNVTVVVIQ